MNDKMSLLDAILHVLKEADGPLSAKQIIDRILSAGLWKTKGKTPDATAAAHIYSDIKTNGTDSPFVRVSAGKFWLRDKAPESVPRFLPGMRPRDAAPGRAKAAGVMSFTDAAEKVLDDFANKRPMHYGTITKKALERGWLDTEGKTPHATMYAQILTEIKRYQRRGEAPRFIQHGKGMVGLSGWTGNTLTTQIEQHNKKTKLALKEHLFAMGWAAFEEFVARLLTEIGFDEVEMTGKRSDGGIDVRATLVIGGVIRTRMAVQVKRWKNNVHTPVVQQLRGSLGTHEHGLIITTSDFSPGALREGERPDAVPVALMNGDQVVNVMLEKGIGVSVSVFNLYDPDSVLLPSVGEAQRER